MTVLDLIVKLQNLPPNMEVMIDVTHEGCTMFKFSEINFVDQIELAAINGGDIVILSPFLFEEQED